MASAGYKHFLFLIAQSCRVYNNNIIYNIHLRAFLQYCAHLNIYIYKGVGTCIYLQSSTDADGWFILHLIYTYNMIYVCSICLYLYYIICTYTAVGSTAESGVILLLLLCSLYTREKNNNYYLNRCIVSSTATRCRKKN